MRKNAQIMLFGIITVTLIITFLRGFWYNHYTVKYLNPEELEREYGLDKSLYGLFLPKDLIIENTDCPNTTVGTCYVLNDTRLIYKYYLFEDTVIHSEWKSMYLKLGAPSCLRDGYALIEDTTADIATFSYYSGGMISPVSWQVSKKDSFQLFLVRVDQGEVVSPALDSVTFHMKERNTILGD